MSRIDMCGNNIPLRNMEFSYPNKWSLNTEKREWGEVDEGTLFHNKQGKHVIYHSNQSTSESQRTYS